MPFVTNRGQAIYFSVQGSGPTVLFQHGLLSHGRRFRDLGYVKRLADRYQVVCVDSLGHGKSSKPVASAFYKRKQRVGDLAAVLDEVGASTAHLVGYSMGGWMTSCFAAEHPKRVASLVLGGWDPRTGPASVLPAGEAGTRALLSAARERYPGLVDWVTPELEPVITACRDAMDDNEGVIESLGRQKPPLFWCGHDDECATQVRTTAAQLGAPTHWKKANHVTAIVNDVEETCAALKEHFEAR